MTSEIFSIASIILLGGGFIAGFYGSSIGSGGLVSLPALLLVGLPTHVAIGTNRLAVIFGEAASAIQYQRHKKLDIRFAAILGIVESFFAIIGSSIVIRIPENYLNIIIAVLLLVIPPIIFLKPQLGMKDGRLTGQKKWLMILVSIPIGLYAGFFGPANGTFLMLALAFCGLSLIQSAAIARAVGIFVALASAITFLFLGAIHYQAGLIMGVGYGVGAWLGVKTSMKKGNTYVKVLLFIIVIASAAKLLWDI